MSILSRHVVLGAFVAAALTLGASAGSGENPRAGAVSFGGLTGGAREEMATLRKPIAAAFESCRGKLLDEALDAFGELTARLKQL